MPNALKYLITGFGRSYDSSSDNYNATQRQLAEDKAKQAEKDREAQAKTTEANNQSFNLRALLGSTMPEMQTNRTPLSVQNTGRGRTLGNLNQYETVNPRVNLQIGERPKTIEDQIKLISESSSETLNRYDKSEKLLNPKKDTFVFDNAVYPKDEKGNIDFNNPLKQKEQPTVEYKDLKPEHVAGQIRLRKEKYIDGKLAGQEDKWIAPRERRSNGIAYVSKDMQKEFDKYNIKAKVAQAQFQTIAQTETDAKTVNEARTTFGQVRLDQVNLIKQSAPVKFQKWYDKLWNSNGKKDAPDINEFTKQFLDAFHNNEFKNTLKLKEGGKERMVEEPGAESFAYFKELARALYGEYPGDEEFNDTQNNNVEVVEEN